MAKTEKKTNTNEKASGKHPGGRPTKYKAEYCDLAYKYCLLGAKDSDLARNFNVAESRINQWKKDHPEFQEALKAGKEVADAKVAESLYHRALGYKHEDVDIRVIEGKIVKTPLTKHYPPDATSAIFWLKNRQPKAWRDKIEVDLLDSTAIKELLAILPSGYAEALKARLIEIKDKK